LPRYYGTEQAADVGAVIPQPERRGAPSEVILVVEDEDRIREVTTEALRELGYTSFTQRPPGRRYKFWKAVPKSVCCSPIS
jgi:hypothetical protein